ncbi:MAG: HAMP domain-containing histidine kinase [Alcaligenaceae bacterium]|nr:HAMP domain-containing histidine kinase [Alcaligenaceae bacterium SAGV5]MPS54744.1 HAMP domain-containing histidine kinase [Alcaligenaceae bacterium SAGV3]MPT58468.1 HAMP domain-containing histidine kinase [Alcaligenaceae bacterium]
MSRRSLLVRLGCAAALMIALALAISGVGLTLIFDRQMERRATAELDVFLKTLAAQLRIETDGSIALDAPLAEPRFEQPYSGLYWQIDAPGNRQLRSRSLWDTTLQVAPARAGAQLRSHWVAGPEHARLLAITRTVVLDDPGPETAVHIAVALDSADLQAERRSFLNLLVPSLFALGIVLMIAMAGFIHLALRPFRNLRTDLRAIHAGRRRQLSRDVPDEVQPVVDDLNRLIAFQDAAVERARTQAGDLAHGLKTPLAVLGALARQIRAQEQDRLADDIDEQVRAMDKHVARALARARAGMAAALGRHTADVAAVARKTLRALTTLPDAQALDWDVDIAGGLRFAGDEGDLTELLGNLLDNGRKWARTRVRVQARPGPDRSFTLRVEDDGPGLPDDEAIHIERGRRWDESRPGTGFGLAITRDLVEAYRGSIAFGRSAELGGLAVIMTLPAPAQSTI